MSNPLVAQRQDSTTWHSGINLIDDAASCYDGVSSGSWVEGGIGAIGAGLDLLTVAMNPVGTLISYGLNFLIEHVKPLKDALDQLAGDADQIAAYSATWANVGKAVGDAAKELGDAVGRDTANWAGSAADAYRRHAQNKTNALQTAATCANTISTAVKIVGVITGAVRGLVRDMVTQAIGDFIQDALEEVFSLGLGTPVVVAQVVEQVAQWTEKIGAVIKKLINSVEALRPLMSKLEELWTAVQKIMKALHGEEPHVSGGGGEGGTHVSSAGEPHSSPSGAGEPHSTPSDTTATSGAHDPSTGGAHDPSTSGGSHDGTHSSSAEGEGQGGGQKSEGNGGCDGKGGDPVDAVSGQMITGETDVDLPGLLPLVLRRAYASGYRGGRLHGPGWSSTLDQRLEFGPDSVRYFGDDAETLHYQRIERSDQPVMPLDGARWPLSWDRDTDTYRVTDSATGWVRHFGPNPRDPRSRPLTALTDRNGNRVDYLRDADGLPTAVTHSGGYHVEVHVLDGAAGRRLGALRLRTATSEDTTLVTYRYDARGRLTEIVDTTGLPYRYEYDDADRLTAWVDRENYRYQYFYRADGRVVRGEGDHGYLSADFHYDLENRVTTVTNSLGQTTAFHYDEHNHLTAVVDPLGNVERTEYDRYHRLLSRTDPLGNTTRYTVDAEGDPVRVDRPDGTTVTVTYNELRQPLEVVGPDGARWRYTYDERGNLLQVTDPADAVTTYTCGEHGEPRAVTDALGNTTRILTNDAGLPVAVTDPSGASETYTRDARGRLIAVVDPLGAVTTLEWGAADRPVRQTHADGRTQIWEWNANGDLTAITDRAGHTTRFEVGPFQSVTARTDPDGTRHTFTHDTELRLTDVTNPQQLTWQYRYDAAGNLVAERDFNGRTAAYAHDAAGRLAHLTNALGDTIALERDSLGRITGQLGGDGWITTFGYDAAGQLVRAANPDCELSFTRDPVGRVLTETVNGRTTTSTYDPLGRRVSRRTPTGYTSTWQYDPVGRPAALTSGVNRITFGHDAAGREVHRWLSPEVAVTSTWDNTGRLTARQLVGVEGAGGQRVSRVRFGRSWTYRADGAIDSMTDADGARRFDLDELGRVTAVRAATWTERYAYDAVGNLTFAEDTRAADSSVAGPREVTGTLVRRAGRTRFDHDAQGRLVRSVRRTLSGGQLTSTYRYDARDRLVEAITPNGERWRYHYDPLGRRIGKQRLDADGAVAEEVRFSWDGEVLAEQEHQIAGAAVAVATTWDHEPGAWTAVTQNRRTYYAGAPQQVVDRQFHAIVTDLIGTPTELVTVDGRVAWRRRTGLWGNELNGGGVECLLRFPGQYHDRETGLDYNQHRYYDPETGRYITSDPLGLDAAPNPHGYVSNPLSWQDPLGLIAKDRYLHMDRPGWTNYVLKDANGKVYYSGMFGPGSTAASTQARHADNHNRFNPANGDTMEVVPGTRTYGESRLMEQRLAEQHGTIIGRDGNNYRGNRENPLDQKKLSEYQEYEQRKQSGLGCPK
ncbi:RHS repeat-associated core domain-containing protein [Lentzea sp. NPDC004782]|uniref:RHS repeat-associated core domain-containing protein n=1 Tax=Lentzea sp. NPDC004782 TaxID=3154458 RepID=UPI0033A1E826